MSRSGSNANSVNFADAHHRPDPIPFPTKRLPPGWKYARSHQGFGPYVVVEDPDFRGERGPKPEA